MNLSIPESYFSLNQMLTSCSFLNLVIGIGHLNRLPDNPDTFTKSLRICLEQVSKDLVIAKKVNVFQKVFLN